MKNKLEIFKKAPDLLDEPEVQELLDYCERLEDELVDLKFEKEKSKELIMLDMIKEVIKGNCTKTEDGKMGEVLASLKTLQENLKTNAVVTSNESLSEILVSIKGNKS